MSDDIVRLAGVIKVGLGKDRLDGEFGALADVVRSSGYIGLERSGFLEQFTPEGLTAVQTLLALGVIWGKDIAASGRENCGHCGGEGCEPHCTSGSCQCDTGTEDIARRALHLGT